MAKNKEERREAAVVLTAAIASEIEADFASIREKLEAVKAASSITGYNGALEALHQAEWRAVAAVGTHRGELFSHADGGWTPPRRLVKTGGKWTVESTPLRVAVTAD